MPSLAGKGVGGEKWLGGARKLLGATRSCGAAHTGAAGMLEGTASATAGGGACWVVAEVPGAPLQEALASCTFQSRPQRSVELVPAAVACREVEATVEATLAIVVADVGAGTGASVLPSSWTLYMAFSAMERSFHRRLKHLSLSPLVKNGGRSGRCSRQNA